MRILTLLALMLLPLSTLQAQNMGWWNQNGDSVVRAGITVTLDGTGIQSGNSILHDPVGPDDAWFHFTFDPPVHSLRFWFGDVDYDESITFGNPLPDHVAYLDLDAVGTPIHTVRGFFTERPGFGAVIWDGPNIASVEFTMSHSAGSIELQQMDLNPLPFEFQAGIDLRTFPYASPAAITLEMAIADPPSGYSGSSFMVERNAMYPCDGQSEIIAIFPRAPGTVRHVRFSDTNVQSGTSYRYRAVPYPGAYDSDFLRLFDPTGWGFEIEVFAAPTTPLMPMTLGQGKLVSFEPYAATLENCSDSCLRTVSGFFPEELRPFVDTGIDVVVTGTMAYAGNNYGTIASFMTAIPTTCTVAVESSTWTNMKSLYR